VRSAPPWWGIDGITASVLRSDAPEEEMPSFRVTAQQKESCPSAVLLLPLGGELTAAHVEKTPQSAPVRCLIACASKYAQPDSRMQMDASHGYAGSRALASDRTPIWAAMNAKMPPTSQPIVTGTDIPPPGLTAMEPATAMPNVSSGNAATAHVHGPGPDRADCRTADETWDSGSSGDRV
jgi:hypothetical protein